MFAGLLLSAASLGDRFARYKTVAIRLAVFGGGSLASALAGSTAQHTVAGDGANDGPPRRPDHDRVPASEGDRR